jgi:hypothetical protein
MLDTVLLPNEEVLLINGAKSGAAVFLTHLNSRVMMQSPLNKQNTIPGYTTQWKLIQTSVLEW